MNKKLYLISLPVIAALCVVGYSLLTTQPRNDMSLVVGDTTKSVTFSNSDLKKVTLEDFEVRDNRNSPEGPVHTDKKFKINLDGGKYIIGAIIYGDCDHQSVGPTLGDVLSMDNQALPNANQVNFRLLFSLEQIEGMDLNFSAHVMADEDGTDNPSFGYQFYYRNYTNDGTDASFYEDITNAGYAGVLQENASSYYNLAGADRAASVSIVGREGSATISRADDAPHRTTWPGSAVLRWFRPPCEPKDQFRDQHPHLPLQLQLRRNP